MRTLSLSDFQAELAVQNVPSRTYLTFICPMCATAQCGQDLIEAGAGVDFAAVEGFIGFSCVGRWQDAPGPRKAPDGKPCNWTLGGLLSLHKLVVIDEDGTRHPIFEPASVEVATAHIARWKAAA